MKKIFLIAISIMTFFAFSVTTFAADSSIPFFQPQSGYDFIEVYSNGNYIAYTWDSSSTSTLDFQYKSINNNSLTFVGTGTIYYYSYNPTLDKWSIDSNKIYNLVDSYYNFNNFSFVKSTVNIYDSSDNLVFPLPPNLAEETEIALQKMTVSLGQVVSIVGLCGVGCLALLIGLNLLRRKSVLFLNR